MLVVKYGESVELCGGTHVANTGYIGMIKIVNESSIAAGIRRITAITGANVEKALDKLEDTMLGIKALLNNAPDVMVALNKSLADNAALRKQAEEFMKERIRDIKAQLMRRAKINDRGITVLTISGEFMADIIKGLALSVKNDKPEHTAFIAATHEAGKPMLTVMLSDDLVAEGLNAGKLVKEGAKHIQGGGGGQPALAQAGGRNVDGLSAAMEAIMASLNN